MIINTLNTCVLKSLIKYNIGSLVLISWGNKIGFLKGASMGEKEFLKLYMKERGLKNLEEAKEKVDTFWKTVKESLEKGEKVKFKDWGNFDMKDVRPRKIVELKTKKNMIIPGSRKIKFCSGKGLIKSINNEIGDGKIDG